LRAWRGLVQWSAVHRTLTEHEAIYDVLAAGDPILAQAAAMMHVNTTETWLRSALNTGPLRGTPDDNHSPFDDCEE
jgi:GntR family transcriptional repressor for pyruvate dehydrogenase complex